MPALETAEILTLLPHRPPLLMVDRVVDYVPGQWLRAVKCVAVNEPWFTGHFPGRPVMPGVLIIEALAQAGALLSVLTLQQDPPPLHLFAGIDRARFKRVVRPGEVLELHAEFQWTRRGLTSIRCTATVEGQLACSAELLSAHAAG